MFPFNPHERTEDREIERIDKWGKKTRYIYKSRTGARHLHKRFIKEKCIRGRCYDLEEVRKHLGHAPRDADERYDRDVNVGLMFMMLEETFVRN